VPDAYSASVRGAVRGRRRDHRGEGSSAAARTPAHVSKESGALLRSDRRDRRRIRRSARLHRTLHGSCYTAPRARSLASNRTGGSGGGRDFRDRPAPPACRRTTKPPAVTGVPCSAAPRDESALDFNRSGVRPAILPPDAFLEDDPHQETSVLCLDAFASSSTSSFRSSC